ncbi:MAG: caspase family protein [Fimbriimonadaceae bacterium]|nr:MAG: caspase family protein [Fimbriimonadaceae bacterium]
MRHRSINSNLRFILGAVALFIASQLPAQSQQSRLRLIPIISDQRLEDIQESPDHTRLLTHDRGYAPRLWEPRSMRLLGVLPHSFSAVSQALMSDSGKLIATLSNEEVRIWNSATATTLGSLQYNGSETFTRLTISPDDQTVVIGGSKGSLWLLKAPLFKWEKLSGLQNDVAVRDLAVSADSSLIAVSSLTDQLLVLNLTTKALQRITGPKEGTAWVDISHDNSQLLGTGLDNQAHLYALPSGSELKTWEHVIGDKGSAPQTLMAALFVGKSFDEILVAGATGTMTIYDRKTFAELRQLKGYSNAIREIRRSRDGLKVATYEDYEGVEYDPLKIWNVETTEEYPFTRAGGPTAGAFNPEGTVFWVGYEDGGIVQHKLVDGTFASNTISAVSPISNIQFFGNTGRVAILPSNAFNTHYVCDSRKIDFTNQYSARSRTIKTSKSGEYAISPGYIAAKSPEEEAQEILAVWTMATDKIRFGFWNACLGADWADESNLIAYDADSVHLFDMSKDPEEAYVREIYNEERAVNWAKPSADGSLVLIKLNKGNDELNDRYQIYNLKTQTLGGKFVLTDYFDINDFLLAGGQPVLVQTRTSLQAYSVDTGELAWEYKYPTITSTYNGSERTDPVSYKVQFSGDGKKLFLATQSHFLSLNPSSGEEIGKFTLHGSKEFYLDASWDLVNGLCAISLGRQIVFVDIEQMKPIVELTLNGTVESITFVPGTQRVIVLDDNEQATIWDQKEIRTVEKPEPLGSFVLMGDDKWLVMDRDGRFDAQDPNDVTGASYVLEWDQGLEPIDVSQFKALFYEPGLFGKLTGYDLEPRRAVPARKEIRLFPTIKVERSERSPNRINVTLEERDNGGIGKIRVLLNGKVVETRDGSGYFSINVDDYKSYLLPASQLPAGRGNEIAVVASNKKGDLSSLPVTVDIGIPDDLTTPQVNMYALFVGVGDYVGNRRDLSAPPMDAIELEHAISKSGERLLPGRVHTTVLTTDKEHTQPGRKEILDWFEQTSKVATSSDIIMVFFAGHGTSAIGDARGYFFLTNGADPGEITPAVLGVHTISAEEMQVALAKIPANKQVIILDTCHSGAAASDIISDRSVSSDYVRAYESIKDSAGTWLLAGAAADQLSYEARQVDHGLLTYSLLEAIDRVSPEGLRATPSGELFLDVQQWLTYAATRVESLRNEVGVPGVQKPELKKSNSNRSFDIGVTREAFRGEIGLKPPKPIVLIGTFDEDEVDSLGLEPLVGKALDDSPNFKIWLNVSKHPNVFRVAGSYTVENDKITLKLYIQKFDAAQKRSNLSVVTLTGEKKDLPGLVQRIRQTVDAEIIKLK